MATGVIYKVNCGSGKESQGRCAKKYDAFCVIYKGEDRPDLDINSGDNLEEILEKLELVVNNLLTQITNLNILITEEVNNIYEQIEVINGILEDLSNRIDELEDRIDDLEATFCDRVADCDAIQNLLDDLHDLETNFCDRVADCRGDIWELVPDKTGCSTSATTYKAWDSSSPTNGYYVETYVDVNPISPTFGDTKVERRSDLDGQCVGEGPNWTSLGTSCSMSSTEYLPSDNPATAIYGFKHEEDTNPNSPSFGEKRWVRDTGHDIVCNPPSLPAQNLEGCMRCAAVQILSTEGQTTDFVNVEFDNLPEHFTYTPGTGICLKGPIWSETDISAYVTGTANVVITDPYNLGWQVLVDKKVKYNGEGDFEGAIEFSIYMNYPRYVFKEGSYYGCKGYFGKW